MKQKLIVALIFLAASSVCTAFESWEHKRLSDLAYHMALTIYCANQNEPLLCGNFKTQLTNPAGLFDPVGNDKIPKGRIGLTYGDVVACVDYFLTTEKLIAGRESTVITGIPPIPDESVQKVDEEPTRGPDLFPYTRDAFDLNQKYRCKDSLWNREGARAQHVNHSHFQAEVIVAQRTNHMLALDLRTREENPFAALLLNAVSDHYLQDSFAPGHIGTWRPRLTDLAATAYHDERNRRGVEVQISVEWLREFAKFNQKTENHGKPVRGDLNIEILRQMDDEVNAAYFFYDPGEGKHRKAQGPTESSKRHDRLERLKDDLAALHILPAVKLRGDKFLWDKKQDLQRYLMLLTDVRSILDVLESRKLDANTYVFLDSFQGNEWAWNYEGQRNTTLRGKVLKTQDSNILATIGPVNYNVHFSDDRSPPGPNTATGTYIAADTLLGASLGVDTMTFGDTHSRIVAGLETPIYGKPVPRHDHTNFGLLAGPQLLYDSGRTSPAVTTRAVWVFPETEFAVSVQGRAMRLNTQSHGGKWRTALGARMDAGFTSFITFYLQSGFDAAVQSDDKIRRGWSVGGGIQLAAPKCRVPIIEALFQCDR